ncbi:NAD(P)H-dependent oxidoreductase [Haliscomenobacter hydrossis]|uniref:NAD(P)H dehydrogenase (Quinone) n=1 Tax=Haliscomenobacter hydrossis (strain ATCC 27775 / DSM 1100 / LMG 10767 / O) TaxID=760192 RepID=F4L6B0_HALH1|nr:NAD(P)H-dependent oxidoreductase [Haliscomenobacter hydrossis]AEE48792.1 NAD(P)H dehydrogenase (quinone) [Haliscomenobacter hydrossis DSM 1100]
MNILIVYCHPSKKSYTSQVFEQLKAVLMDQHWSLEVSDLYAMDFQSDLSKNEYEREGFAKTAIPIPNDVLAEHKKIDHADCIAFVYPAKLKGWFDRVYSLGYAYGHKDNIQKMKTLKFGLVICTAGHPIEFLAEIGIAQSMQTIFLDDRMGKRFEHKEMLILGGTLELEQVRERHKQELEGVVGKIRKYCA